jgi:hypothetical protein
VPPIGATHGPFRPVPRAHRSASPRKDSANRASPSFRARGVPTNHRPREKAGSHLRAVCATRLIFWRAHVCGVISARARARGRFSATSASTRGATLARPRAATLARSARSAWHAQRTRSTQAPNYTCPVHYTPSRRVPSSARSADSGTTHSSHPRSDYTHTHTHTHTYTHTHPPLSLPPGRAAHPGKRAPCPPRARGTAAHGRHRPASPPSEPAQRARPRAAPRRRTRRRRARKRRARALPTHYR